jgi:hypothetical protein
MCCSILIPDMDIRPGLNGSLHVSEVWKRKKKSGDVNDYED